MLAANGSAVGVTDGRASRDFVIVATCLGLIGFVVAWLTFEFLGRHGLYGYVVISDTSIYERVGDAVAAGQFPYRDFDFEYPPAALPVFVIPSLLSTAGSIDAFDRIFECLMLASGLAATAFVGVTLWGLRATRVRVALALAFVAASPLLIGPLILSHFDPWPAALMSGALAAAVVGHERIGSAGLGVATMAKVYPIVGVPLVIVHVWRTRGRRAALICTGICAGVGALILAPFLVLAPDGVLNAVQRQLDRPLQVESLGAAALFVLNGIAGVGVTVVSSFGSQNLAGGIPDALAGAETVLLAIALLAIWIGFARGSADREELIRASAAAVVVYVAFGKVLSPQYLIWLMPLVPLVGGRRGVAAAILVAAAGILTQVYFPGQYFDLVNHLDAGVAQIILTRDLLLVAAAGVLALPADRLAAASAWTMRHARSGAANVNGMRPETALGLVLLTALALRAIWLWLPQGSLIFDETYYVNAARVILGWHVPAGAPYATAALGLDPNTEHPPLGKLLIAGSMAIFGDNAFGWRIPSLIAGMASLAAVYAIVRGLRESAWIAVLAVALYSLDVLSFLHGRIGTLDMMALAFTLAGAALAIRRQWILAGIAFALGALVKETAVFGLLAWLLLEGLAIVRLHRDRPALRWSALQPAARVLGAFVVVGCGGLWFLDVRFTRFDNPFDAISHIIGYGISLTGGPSPSGIASNPWDWLVNDGQFDYLRIAVNSVANGQVVASQPTIDFHALLNPVLIGSAALAVPFALWLAWRQSNRLAEWAIVWIAATYLPYYALALLAHRVSYLYYILPAVPALAIATALLLARAGLPRVVTWVYVAASAVAFVAWFPFRQLP